MGLINDSATDERANLTSTSPYRRSLSWITEMLQVGNAEGEIQLLGAHCQGHLKDSFRSHERRMVTVLDQMALPAGLDLLAKVLGER
ncbi:unnamed protein product, partial [Iphiclides podalirius]